MTTFVLITEGITDQAVLEAVVYAYCEASFDGDIDINFLQPPRDATDASRAADAGGWERVLEHCLFTQRIVEALSLNDYLIIQIDTDCCEHANFGVSRTVDGIQRSVSEIVEDVKALIIVKLGEDILEEFGERILFAICVESIECWLLPIYAGATRKKSRILNCEDHLRRELRTESLPLRKDYKGYRQLASRFKKLRDVEAAAEHNESLRIFLSTLPYNNC